MHSNFKFLLVSWSFFLPPVSYSQHSNLRPDDALVDVVGEDGGGRQQRRVSRRHHSGCDGTDAQDGGEGRGEMLEGDGQDDRRLASLQWGRRAVGGLVPVWELQGEHALYHTEDLRPRTESKTLW